jgi:hypothetical protein
LPLLAARASVLTVPAAVIAVVVMATIGEGNCPMPWLL